MARSDAKSVRTRAHVVFEGLVQGVFFRANTKRCADSLGLTGWVRNRFDGSVEAVFEGDEDEVHQAIEWCATKQPYARVSKKTVETSPATGEFESFSVR
ncbi:MAG: acylphosphatase [Candidatus Thermoplasmatota archaeon]|nr:acylphosphatase [Candidatus Thermoplasmatota archaeon]